MFTPCAPRAASNCCTCAVALGIPPGGAATGCCAGCGWPSTQVLYPPPSGTSAGGTAAGGGAAAAGGGTGAMPTAGEGGGGESGRGGASTPLRCCSWCAVDDTLPAIAGGLPCCSGGAPACRPAARRGCALLVFVPDGMASGCTASCMRGAFLLCVRRGSSGSTSGMSGGGSSAGGTEACRSLCPASLVTPMRRPWPQAAPCSCCG
jgi:hypothetical protein